MAVIIKLVLCYYTKKPLEGYTPKGLINN